MILVLLSGAFLSLGLVVGGVAGIVLSHLKAQEKEGKKPVVCVNCYDCFAFKESTCNGSFRLLFCSPECHRERLVSDMMFATNMKREEVELVMAEGSVSEGSDDVKESD